MLPSGFRIGSNKKKVEERSIATRRSMAATKSNVASMLDPSATATRVAERREHQLNLQRIKEKGLMARTKLGAGIESRKLALEEKKYPLQEEITRKYLMPYLKDAGKGSAKPSDIPGAAVPEILKKMGGAAGAVASEPAVASTGNLNLVKKDGVWTKATPGATKDTAAPGPISGVTPVKKKRKLRPSIENFLSGVKSDFREMLLPDIFKKGARKGYDWTYPELEE